MIVASAHPLKSTLVNLLHGHTSINFFNQIHALLLTSGIAKHFLIAAKIAERLSILNFPSLAYKTIKQIYHHHHHHHPTPFLFNSLISGYARGKTPHLALAVYKHMVEDGFLPDKYTFPIVLKSCMRFSGIEEARQVHCAATKRGLSCELFVQNALVHVYGMCGECVDASYLFEEMSVRDVVSWTGLISGFVKAGCFSQALTLFASMDVEPNLATLVSVLIACGRIGDQAKGEMVHGLIVKRETEMGIVARNALLDMYVKCESLEAANRVFDELPQRDLVSWTSLISGLVQCKRPKDAIDVFHDMQASGVEPDKVVLSSMLSACASLGALDLGRWVHDYIDRKGIEWDVHIGTAMVDMYAKCGCLKMAFHTFHKMPHKNVPSWNALLGGLALHGHGKDALDHFDQMVRSGIIPNDVTFVAILGACSHAGLVEEGRRHFDSMTKFYNLTPKIEHYGCMIDLLGKAGLLGEAHKLIRTMPMKADVFIWGAMLSACKAHGNVELSQQILGHLLELEPCDSGVYVLLSNIFATKDRWGDVTMVRKLMRKRGVKKEPGSSVIEVNGKAHEFLVGECDHPQNEEIGLMLYILSKQVQLNWQ